VLIAGILCPYLQKIPIRNIVDSQNVRRPENGCGKNRRWPLIRPTEKTKDKPIMSG
jgi:hypothetical protein